MPEKVIDSFQVRRLDILDEKGQADMALLPSMSEAYIRRMYELIVLSRTFDQFALDLQREGRAAVEFLAVQSIDRLLSVIRRTELHKPETPGTPRVTVRYDPNIDNLSSVRSEHLPEGRLLDIERQISDI